MCLYSPEAPADLYSPFVFELEKQVIRICSAVFLPIVYWGQIGTCCYRQHQNVSKAYLGMSSHFERALFFFTGREPAVRITLEE